MLELVLIVLAFLAVMLVSANNLSICVGPVIGARIISKRVGVLLGAVGFSAGLLIQGSSMARSVTVLLSDAPATLHVAALIVAIIIFIVAGIIRVPLSLSMSLFGLLAGLSVSQAMPTSSFILQVVAFWFIAPMVSAVLAFIIVRALSKQQVSNIWRRLRLYKIVLIALSISSAYVLGTNTIGLVVATAGFSFSTVAAALAAIFIGCSLLSAGPIRRVSEEFFLMRYSNATATLLTSTILVEIGTLLNFPLSNTETTAAAVFGTGMSYKTKFMSLKPFLIIVAGWIVAPLISFLIGLML